MRALFVDKFKQTKTKEINGTPHEGNIIPIFGYNPPPKVKSVIWFPEDMGDEFKGLELDIVVVVE